MSARVRRLVGDVSRLPHRYSVILALSYFALSCLWIEYSGAWAKSLAHGSIDSLNDIERYKGFLFVLSKASLLYIFCHVIFSRITQNAKALLHSEERRIEAEREAVPALLAASVAHDVANMLTVFRLNVERIKQIAHSPDDVMSCVAKLDRSTDRLTEVVMRLRGASRSLFRDPPKSFDFSGAVKDTIELMRTHASVRNSQVEFLGPHSLSLCGYPVLIHQIVMNLVINAGEAVGVDGEIRFTSSETEHGVCLVAEDNGPGIPITYREKILGAFYTTKASGTGLGLMSVKSCVEIHDGWMEVGDSELGGAKFTIHLPNLSLERICELRSPDRAAHVGNRNLGSPVHQRAPENLAH